MSGEELMGVMRGVYDNSRHLQMDGVEFQDDIKNVEFEIDEDDDHWRRICIDGEIITVEKGTVVIVGLDVEETISLCY
jgi:hypothetical protein